jgi:hypothetical protein
VVPFPPRNEPLAFRQQLESVYQTQLRRNPITTFVDLEGDIVWTQEYLRYRVNSCDDATAAQKVFTQIGGGGIQPVCTTASVCSISVSPTPQSVPFAQGTFSVSVSATPQCGPWTSTSDQPWLSVGGSGSGTGNATVNYSVSSNAGASRTGHITVAAGSNGSAQLTVNQESGQVSASLAASSTTGLGADNCRIDPSGNALNPALVKCVFDSSASTPASLINGQQFVVVESGKPLVPNGIVPTTVVLSEPITSCGFGTQTTTLVTIQLTVTTSDGRSAVSTRKVTFTKNGVC